MSERKFRGFLSSVGSEPETAPSKLAGRDALLNRLCEALGRSTRAAVAVVGKAPHGSGGVGKTRLAVEYARRYEPEYTAILYVSAQTPQDLRRNLAGLVGRRALDLPEKEAAGEEARVAATVRWLNDHPGWLLILDNLDTPQAAAAAEGLLTTLRGGHVLLTGRSTQWGPGVERLELDVLGEADAAQFLLERTERGRRAQPSDPTDAAELARELDGVPLALELAGACVAHRRLSLADYLGLLRSHAPAVAAWHDERVAGYPRSVAVACETTLRRLGPGDTAFVRLTAWLAPEPAPTFMLEGEKAQAVWKEAVGRMREEAPTSAEAGGLQEARDSLSNLASHGMVRWDAAGERFSVHRAVQEVVRTRLPRERGRDWLALGLRLLDAARPGNPTDARTWPQWDALRPHVAHVVGQADSAGVREPTGRLMNYLSLLLSERGLYAEAESLLRRAVALGEEGLGPDHPDVGIRLSNLATLLQTTDRPAEAEPLVRRALAVAERSHGPDDPRVATALNNLAQLLKVAGRLAEAEPLLQRSLAIAENSLGRDHPNVAVALNNLAGLLQAANRPARAEPLMRRVIVILLEYTRSTGHEHPYLRAAIDNYAALLRALGASEQQVRAALDAITQSLP